MKNLIIILLILLSLIPFIPFMILFTVLYRIKNKTVSKYFFLIGVSLSQVINVIYQDFFNKYFIKKDSPYKFGNTDETTSSVLGINHLTNHLTKTGNFVRLTLDTIDPKHCQSAVEWQLHTNTKNKFQKVYRVNGL